jgi:Isochorismatase family
VRAAAVLGYRVTVLSDCVTDPAPEVNQILLAKGFPRQADVIDADQYVGALGQ